MLAVNIHEAKTHLSRLVEDTAHGKAFIIAKAGKPMVKVVPFTEEEHLVVNGYTEVPILSDHALALDTLPLLHLDPFDRILVAQARSEGMQLLTVDEQVARYGEGVVSV